MMVTSTGIPSLDNLYSQGIPLGRTVCIREDWPRSSANYSSSLLKCMIAEGLASEHLIFFLDCIEEDPQRFLAALPGSISTASTTKVQPAEGHEPTDEKMTIAWRYRHLRQLEGGNVHHPSGNANVRCYDFGKKTTLSERERTMMHSLGVFDKDYEEKSVRICEELIQRANSQKTVLRIVIRSLGSPFMSISASCRLLYRLQRIVNGTTDNAIIFFTLPAYALNNDECSRIEAFASTSIDLQSFIGTRHENNRALSEYNGFLRIVKPLRSPGMLSLMLPETNDLAFKMQRRQFIVETFHLPPDLSETPSRVVEASKAINPISGCSSSSNKLDF